MSPDGVTPVHVRRRPATSSSVDSSSKPLPNPQVISSIIASLDHTSSLTHASYAYLSAAPDTAQDCAPPSEHASAARPTLKHSQSFGMDYGAYRSPPKDQDYDSDGADFPVIRTSRRPSGKSHHTAPPSPSLNGLKDILRSASKTSLSSYGHERLSRSNSRLSAESWVRQQTSPSKLSLDAATDKLGRRLSLRQTSRDTLRSCKSHQQSADQALLSPISPLDAKEPSRAVKSPKGRLYLEDVMEDTDMASPSVSVARPLRTTTPPSAIKTRPEKSPVRPLGKAPVASSTKSPIADAVPLRTSSLNKIPSSGKPRSRKLSKGKRPMAPLKEEKPRRKSKTKAHPPEDIFEGLDEEDQTVKRIKQLRQQKEDRLRKESEALQTQNDGGPVPDLTALPVTSPKSPANKLSARSPDLRKARRMLGLESPTTPSAVHHQEAATVSPLPTNKQPSGSREPPLKRNLAQDLSNFPPDSPILGNAFSTQSNPYRPFRTGAAYASGEPAYESSSIGRRAVARGSTSSHLLNGLDIEGLDLSPPGTAQSNSTFQSRNKTSIAGRQSYDAKTRRKSMSDARETRLLEDEILRERQDSVSTAVNAFLSNPRLNQKVRHPHTGRVISFSEVGDPCGTAVIVCVGMGLTRFVSVFYDDLASSLGLRLITPERPGVGASEPLRERDNIGPLGWPDDVLTITQHLGISQFSLVAHSAGALYALATALILPQSVRGKVQLLAPWIPPSQFEKISAKDRSPDDIPVAALTRGQRFLRVLPVPFLKAANGNLFSPASLKPAHVRSGSNSPGCESPRGVPRRRNSKKRPEPLRRESMILMDQVIPERPRDTMFPLPELYEEEKTGVETIRKPSLELSATASPMDPAFTVASEALMAAEHAARAHQAAYSTLLTERTWTLATRDSNPAVDLIVCLERHREIGFRYVDIHRKVVITHGSEDKRVPVENIRWIGDQMNRYNALHVNLKEKDEIAAEGGCEIRVLPGEGHGLMANPGVMADVLAEISRDWVATRW